MTIQLCGELDFATVAELWPSLPVLSSDVSHVEVDLSRLEFCDIAGMRAVHQFCVEQRKAGRSVQVTGARPYFRKVARISGLVPQALEG